jgi:hypothetical protein
MHMQHSFQKYYYDELHNNALDIRKPKALAQLVEPSSQGMMPLARPWVTGSNPVESLEVSPTVIAVSDWGEGGSRKIFLGKKNSLDSRRRTLGECTKTTKGNIGTQPR